MARRNGRNRNGYGNLSPDQIADLSKNQSLTDEELLPMIAAISASLSYLKLKPGKRRVLAVNLLPEALDFTDARKAALARVCPRYFYNCKHDKKLNAANKQISGDTVGHTVPEMWGRVYRLARQNYYPAIMTLLQKAGEIDPAGALVNINVGNRTDDELAGIVYENLEITPAKATGNRDGSRRIAQA